MDSNSLRARRAATPQNLKSQAPLSGRLAAPSGLSSSSLCAPSTSFPFQLSWRRDERRPPGHRVCLRPGRRNAPVAGPSRSRSCIIVYWSRMTEVPITVGLP